MAPQTATITFQGLICFVFDPKRNRAVLIRAHPGEHAHVAVMQISSGVNQVELDAATGLISQQSGGKVLLSPLDGMSIRLVDWDGKNATPVDGGSLDQQLLKKQDTVPHLFKEGSNGTMVLSAATFADIPDNFDIAAFVELEGGTFSKITDFQTKSHFVKDFANEKSRSFANVVELTVRAKNSIALQFSRIPNQWKTVTFSGSTAPTIDIANLANPPMYTSHFSMFSRLAAPLQFDDIAPAGHDAKEDLVPGCSDTQYP